MRGLRLAVVILMSLGLVPHLGGVHSLLDPGSGAAWAKGGGGGGGEGGSGGGGNEGGGAKGSSEGQGAGDSGRDGREGTRGSGGGKGGDAGRDGGLSGGDARGGARGQSQAGGARDRDASRDRDRDQGRTRDRGGEPAGGYGHGHRGLGAAVSEAAHRGKAGAEPGQVGPAVSREVHEAQEHAREAAAEDRDIGSLTESDASTSRAGSPSGTRTRGTATAR